MREDPERVVRRVGRRIAELRRAQDITQAAFAKKLRATVQWVSRVEVGENLTLHTLTKVANVFGVRVIELFTEPSPEATRVKRGRPRKTSKPSE